MEHIASDFLLACISDVRVPYGYLKTSWMIKMMWNMIESIVSSNKRNYQVRINLIHDQLQTRKRTY